MAIQIAHLGGAARRGRFAGRRIKRLAEHRERVVPLLRLRRHESGGNKRSAVTGEAATRHGKGAERARETEGARQTRRQQPSLHATDAGHSPKTISATATRTRRKNTRRSKHGTE